MRIFLVGAPPLLRVYLPPLGIGYIASALEREGHEVEVLSLTRPPVPTIDRIVEAARGFRPDVVGHCVLSPTFDSSRRILAALRDALPACRTVVGGAHPSALPEHAMRRLGADFAVVGEAEWTMVDLFRGLEAGGPDGDLGGVSGLVWRRNGEVRVNEPRPFEPDPERFGSPAWHLLRPEEYRNCSPQAVQKRFPSVQILTSRGCPFECSFCAAFRTMGRQFRPRQATSVVDEMEGLERERGMREFMLLDLNFTWKRAHCLSVCREIVSRGRRFVWKPLAGFRVDLVDDELLDALRDAGCYQVLFGIESGVQTTIDRLRKGLDVSLVRDRVAAAKRRGLYTASFFILGAPGETADEVRQTVRYARKLPLDFAGFFLWTPMPGAADWEHLSRKVDLETFDWQQLNYDHGHSDTIPQRDLRRRVRLAHIAFYANPRRILALLSLMHLATLRGFLEFAGDALRGRRGRARM